MRRLLIASLVIAATPLIADDKYKLQEIQSLNNVSNSVNSLNSSVQEMGRGVQFVGLLQAFAQYQQMAIQEAQIAMQERWNQWNAMVSLLNEEQKQKVLAFNMTPDSELINVWKEARKNKTEMPVSWLTPPKRTAFLSTVTEYIATQMPVEEYLEYMKSLDQNNRKPIWNVTIKEKKKELAALLKDRHDKYLIDNLNEFSLWRGCVDHFWGDGFFLMSDWNSYQNDKKDFANGVKKTEEHSSAERVGSKRAW